MSASVCNPCKFNFFFFLHFIMSEWWCLVPLFALRERIAQRVHELATDKRREDLGLQDHCWVTHSHEIPIEHDEIGVLADLDRPQLVLLERRVGAIQREPSQCLCPREHLAGEPSAFGQALLVLTSDRGVDPLEGSSRQHVYYAGARTKKGFTRSTGKSLPRARAGTPASSSLRHAYAPWMRSGPRRCSA